MTVQIPSACF